MTNRICGSCRHFLKIEGSNTGHCTNPLVVSHQGGLVMYREAEIGCRRGWKQDLWEPILVQQDESGTETPDIAAQIDRGRAAAWANLAPVASDESANLLSDAHPLNDEDLFDPRRTRDAREAIRRAREAKKRELHASVRRDPEDQPILSAERTAGEDTVLDVRPVPLERQHQPIVPPVSADEIRRSVEKARQAKRGFESMPPVSFREEDERFSSIPERESADSPSQSSQVREPAVTPHDTDYVAAEAVIPQRSTGTDRVDDIAQQEPVSIEPLSREAPESMQAFEAETFQTEPLGDDVADWDSDEPIEGWPEQAPWAQDEPAFDAWIEKRPKRRSWFGSLLHRHHQPARGAHQPQPDPVMAWEPDQLAAESDQGDLEPWNAAPQEAPRSYRQPIEPMPAEVQTASVWPETDSGVLPPLPYDVDDDEGEDLLLSQQGYESEEEDQIAARVPRVCATCRYFRPEGTCGNSFAFTFRRRVDEERLSCASSIGSWWLPSDRYWESVVDFAHHGQPTPLLDRFSTQAEEPGTDDELHTQ